MQRIKFRQVTTSITLALFISLAPSFALALGKGDTHKNEKGKGHEMHKGKGYGHHKKGKDAVSVPELDPGSASAALALLVGGALVLSSRRRGALVAS